ncbi:hypothetical protein MKX29_23970 [Cytobacillus sp. FSL R7-0696]
MKKIIAGVVLGLLVVVGGTVLFSDPVNLAHVPRGGFILFK